MYKVTQTKVVIKDSNNNVIVNGNCYPAAIASLLELPIEEVPNFEVFYRLKNNRNFWLTVIDTWLNSQNLELRTADEFKCFHDDIDISVYLRNDDESYDDCRQRLREELRDKYYLVSGLSVRGVSHVCIYKNGIMVHDPHPTREGLIELKDFQTIEGLEEFLKNK